jgi:hypothetical protein
MNPMADKNEIPPLEQISPQETGTGLQGNVLNAINHHSKRKGREMDIDGLSVLCCSRPIEVSNNNVNSAEVVDFASEDQNATSRQWNDSVEEL